MNKVENVWPIHINRQIGSTEVLYNLSELFIAHGIPVQIRSDNGSEFTSESILMLLQRLRVKTAFIELDKLRENSYIESFNGKLRIGLLNEEIFDSILEA